MVFSNIQIGLGNLVFLGLFVYMVGAMTVQEMKKRGYKIVK